MPTLLLFTMMLAFPVDAADSVAPVATQVVTPAPDPPAQADADKPGLFNPHCLSMTVAGAGTLAAAGVGAVVGGAALGLVGAGIGAAPGGYIMTGSTYGGIGGVIALLVGASVAVAGGAIGGLAGVVVGGAGGGMLGGCGGLLSSAGAGALCDGGEAALDKAQE